MPFYKALIESNNRTYQKIVEVLSSLPHTDYSDLEKMMYDVNCKFEVRSACICIVCLESSVVARPDFPAKISYMGLLNSKTAKPIKADQSSCPF